LYGTLEQFPEIEDSIAVGQLREGDTDEKVLMFLRMRGGEILQNELRDRICTAIRSALSPRHVPAFIMQVTDIPYTKNGKKIENIVRAIVSGRNPKASNTISNPESLAEYYKFVKIGNPERPHALRGKL
jgi:acetoacetyl-CoA synthetase